MCGVGVHYPSFWGPAINALLPKSLLWEHQTTSPQTTLVFVERPDARNFTGHEHFRVTRGTSNQLCGIGGNSAKAYHGGKFVYAYYDGHVAALEPKRSWGRLGSVNPWAGDWPLGKDD